MKKTIYYVSSPYYGDGEYEILIMEVDINHVLETGDTSEYRQEFDTLEEAKAYIVKQYETIIAWYQRRMTNINVEHDKIN
jgi:hypothetical protein